MFVASVIIYGLNLLQHKLNLNKSKFEVILIVISIIMLFWSYTFFIGVCILGSCLRTFKGVTENFLNKQKKLSLFALFFSIVMLSGGHELLYETTSIKMLRINQYWEILYAFVLILIICSNEKIKLVLSNDSVHKFSDVSIPVYLLHYPIIYYLGCSIIALFRDIGWLTAYSLTLFIVVAVLVIVTIVYGRPTDKLANCLLNNMKIDTDKHPKSK